MASPWKHEKFTKISLENIDKKFAKNTNQQVNYLLKKMKLKSGDRILDLGCGAGRHSIEFTKNGIKVTGIDISPTMIKQAIKRCRFENLDINFIEDDLVNLADLELDSKPYKGAICLCESGIGVLGASKSDFDFFSTVYELLDANASCVITCFNSIRRYIRSRDNNPRFDFINSTINWSADIEGEHLEEIQRQYCPSEIKMLLSLCGFKDIEVLSCKDGNFSNYSMDIEDIEMLVVARK